MFGPSCQIIEIQFFFRGYSVIIGSYLPIQIYIPFP